MQTTNIKDSFLKGGKIAIQRLLDRKRKDDTYIFISDKGVVKKVDAKEIKSNKL